MRAGEFQRAIEEFDAIPVWQRTRPIHFYRALCWANLGKDVEARAEIASARVLIPKDDDWDAESLAVEYIRGFAEAPARERPITTALYLGDTHRAIELADAALHQAPENADLLELRGMARLVVEVTDNDNLASDALGEFAAAVRCDPSNPDRYITRGMWIAIFHYPDRASKLQAIDHAIADFSEAVRLQPSALAFQLRADAYLQKRDFKSAEEDLTHVLERLPRDKATSAAAFFCRGILRRRLMNDAGARHDFLEAQRLKPAIVDDPLFPFSAISDNDAVFRFARGYSSKVLVGLLLDDMRRNCVARARSPNMNSRLLIERILPFQ